jgi:hypothetical protein
MSRNTWMLGVLLTGTIGLSMAGAAVAQNSQTGLPAGSLGEILAELRGIRADLAQAHRADQQAQLLGMRLQLQEQRVTAVGRHLADVQERLRENGRAKEPLLAALKMFEKDPDADAEKEEIEFIAAPLKSQIAALEKAGLDLRAEEADAARMLAEEQARWTAFNARIEELERSLTGRSVR